jgi:hypothetical protein
VKDGNEAAGVAAASGRRGPQLPGGAFMEDSKQALASLDRLAMVQGDTLLPGYGGPCTDRCPTRWPALFRPTLADAWPPRCLPIVLLVVVDPALPGKE